MALAIFGITNSALNLVATLFVLMLVVLWLALIVYTYLDARRRISDPFLVACATVASFFPYIGTAVYAIVRPPEYLEDAHERELEIRAAEKRLALLQNRTCRNCGSEVESSFLRCPTCMRKLKEPCRSCRRPLDPRWKVCPYCEAEVAPVAGAARPDRRRRTRRQATSEEPRVQRQSADRSAFERPDRTPAATTRTEDGLPPAEPQYEPRTASKPPPDLT
jgi:Double zinc ribbon